MGFTLGGLDEVDDPQVRMLLAVDAEERVLAVTSWLPVRAEGVTVGWTLDFMRRRADAPPGVMEFLIATAALDVRADGAALLSLSGAPLARHATDGATDGDGLQRLLDLFARRLEPVYGFGSLSAFKAKFQPLYRPLFLAYPDPVALPVIGNALARAYLPELTPRALTRLARGRCWGNRRGWLRVEDLRAPGQPRQRAGQGVTGDAPRVLARHLQQGDAHARGPHRAGGLSHCRDRRS